MTIQASNPSLEFVSRSSEITPSLEIASQFPETTEAPDNANLIPRMPDQTGYAREFRRPQPIRTAGALAVGADDTVQGDDFTLDLPEGPRRAVPSIQLLGETFHVELDDELGVVVSHHKWSLMGYGYSIAKAEEMLMNYARELAESMIDDSPIEYTEEGNRLRDFVLEFLYLSPR
ncbi:MAG: hypothetical protein OXO56_14205 [Gammaproteobacteria bacterium]|nr:hypothetical protein [Gammaproteobacteria bacterium]